MTTYLAEWLTLDQAAHTLGIDRTGLKELWEDGDIDVHQIRPGVWRVKTSTVDDLKNTPAWKARTCAPAGTARPAPSSSQSETEHKP